MPVETKRVYSSFVDTLTYDSEAGILTVTYQSGRQSRHAASPEIAADIWDAPSIGQALHNTIPGFSSVGKRAKPR